MEKHFPIHHLVFQNYECEHFPQSWGSHDVKRWKLDYWDIISSDLKKNQPFTSYNQYEKHPSTYELLTLIHKWIYCHLSSSHTTYCTSPLSINNIIICPILVNITQVIVIFFTLHWIILIQLQMQHLRVYDHQYHQT